MGLTHRYAPYYNYIHKKKKIYTPNAKTFFLEGKILQ